MSKVELHKSIEAKRLNPRSGLPLKEPPVTIPYAAILERIEPDRDLVRFSYLGQRYICKYELIREAAEGIEDAASVEEVAAAPVDETATAAPAPSGPALEWEVLNSPKLPTRRAKVPGGWLVSAGGGVCFYPDPKHQWSGATE